MLLSSSQPTYLDRCLNDQENVRREVVSAAAHAFDISLVTGSRFQQQMDV